MIIRCSNGCNAIIFISVSQDFMPSFFVMVASFWMVFWEHKIELFWFFSVTEETDVVVNSIADGDWGSED